MSAETVELAIDRHRIIAAVPIATDDNGLLRAAGAGDRHAFETLYRRHVGRVYALCLRLTAETHTAEELTQEAFVRAWQRLAKFRGDSLFSTWLHRLTVNVVCDHQRRARPWRKFWVDSDANTEVADMPAPSIDVQLDLDAAIQRLPERARTVFVLHDVEGWQHEEIAASTGTAVGTSKAHLHRARQLLREWLSI
jgi:RNA polymerase sigma-70 factor (ECF subfamily)